ncbi:MAG: DUF2341 domain-containing protein [Planctomycetota bacterium]|jgi:hypothetical protein
MPQRWTTRRRFTNTLWCFLLLVGLIPASSAVACQNETKARSASFYLLTTPEGADLPAVGELKDFPLLVRLNRETFDFAAARLDGSDLRFYSAEGQPLAHQVEAWDAAEGTAVIWVRVPLVRGNERQELKLVWGQEAPAAPSAVFDATNGFASVWHLGPEVRDEVGTLEMKDVATKLVEGVIGKARQLDGGQGWFGGEQIPDYPFAGQPHSTSAWFRPERSNCTLIGWGNEGGGRGSKVRMQLRSPPHLHIDSDFSDVDAPEPVALGQWHHVVHTYADGEGKIYLDGKLAGRDTPRLDIKSPARLWLGGWYHHYDFVGGLDEVRVSRVARSAEWIKLEYENQKPNQTAVGLIVQPGAEFGVSMNEATVPEGDSLEIKAQAGGAQKLYWVLLEPAGESILAVDRLSVRYRAPRVAKQTEQRIELRAIYPGEVRKSEVKLTIPDSLPEPEVSLSGRATWNGREPLTVDLKLGNLAALQAAGVAGCEVRWSCEGVATIRRAEQGRLVLLRAQGSGPLVVHCSVSNGGPAVEVTHTLEVQEPGEAEPWIEPTPREEEAPQTGQFFARNPATGKGTVFYRGKLELPADKVFARLFGGEQVERVEAVPGADGSYSLKLPIAARLRAYTSELGVVREGKEEILQRAADLVCGDAYLIIGQSNAVATDFGEVDPFQPSMFLRTFGATDGSPQGSRLRLWANAVARAPGGKSEIGYWGMVLGNRLVESHQIPICIINGAVGGTRIDQHQRDPADPMAVDTIYGRLLWRVREAGLTQGIRGIFWHQGENDQGADGPSGGYGWETYRQLFIDLAAAWKQDYPNVSHYFVFQIWPKACAMGRDGSDDRLRDVQRTLPRHFSNLSVMSTLGIKPPGGCHFPAAGYQQFAELILPVVQSRIYQQAPQQPVTPPNLLRARWADPGHTSIALEFDQPVNWDDSLCDQFALDGKSDLVLSGRREGKTLVLLLREGAVGKQITYLDSDRWSQEKLLWGVNGLAALTFCDVDIEQP